MKEKQKNVNSNPRKKRNLKKKAKPTLAPPYRWRCRVCSEEGLSEVFERHCGQIVRQLAPVSKENAEWFSNFLSNNKWKFISPKDIEELHCIVRTPDLFSIAEKAGRELLDFLNNTLFETPKYFELYNSISDHLRISDLKKNKETKKQKLGFETALNTALKWHGKTPPPLEKAPTGPIERGHIFDEFLTKAIMDLQSDDWAPGNKVEFFCQELNLTVCGSPDLRYNGIPVETKTTSKLPKRKKSKPKWYKAFRQKWNKNYLPQVAMYSQACQCDVMFILLIARNTAEFSILPVNGDEKYQVLRNKWENWVSDSRVMDKVAKYREYNSMEV
jgi:hypothetical protein